MTAAPQLPAGVQLVRTTTLWDEASVPTGLLSGHRVADGVWGQLLVHKGSVGFVFEDEPDVTIHVGTDDRVVIPPGRYHDVVVQRPATFAVEFYREPNDHP